MHANNIITSTHSSNMSLSYMQGVGVIILHNESDV